MAANIDISLIRARVDDHIARWMNIMLSAGETKVELAEQAAYDLHWRVKGSAPQAVLWCDSPYQAAMIPLLVANVRMSPEWRQLIRTMESAGKPGSAQWETCWIEQHNWLRKKMLDELTNFIFQRYDLSQKFGVEALDVFPRPTAMMRSRLLRRLGENLRILAARGAASLPPSEADYASQRRAADDRPLEYFALVDLDFVRAMVAVSQRVEARAGLKLELNMLSVMAPVFHVWDSRILGPLLPKQLTERAEGFSKPIRELLDETREKCRRFEALSLRTSRWLRNALIRWRDPDPAIDFQSGNQFINGINAFLQSLDVTGAQSDELNFASRAAIGRITTWLPYGAHWLPFALACRFVDPSILGDVEQDVECWAYLAHGSSGFLVSDGICYLVRKPTVLKFDEAFRIHNDDGPAASWSDEFSIYSLRGVVVNPSIVKQRRQLTVRQILRQRNIEIRRVMIELYGQSRYLMDAGAILLHRDECGMLYRVEVPDDEPLVMVKVRNSTPEPDGKFRYYFLRVPPSMRTAREAVAWTFGLLPTEYQPARET